MITGSSVSSMIPNSATKISHFGMKRMKKSFLPIVFIVLPVLMLFIALAALAVNVPYWDDYGAIVRYMGWPLAERMQHLLDFHNEHRIATVRLFLEAMATTTGKVNFKTCMLFGSAQLLVIFASFAFLYLKQFGKSLGLAVLIYASAHLFSLLNFDNAFWALTALENFGVLMWAFFAIIAYHTRKRCAVGVLAWVFAILAILTSAQGLAVLGCFVLMTFGDETDASRHRKARFLSTALVATTSAAVGALYFHGFASGGTTNETIHSSIVDKVLYVVAFLGNIIPVYPIALLCGFLIAGAIAFTAWNYHKIPLMMRPVFFFMVYCVGVAVAGVFFRASDPRAALSFRYYIITACLVISLVGCLLSLEGRLPRLVRKCVPILAIGFCLMDTAVFCIGWPMFKERNEALRLNILTWPETNEGLRIEETSREQASLELNRLEGTGLYNHGALLRDGEIRPAKPIPWPTPHFP